MDMKVILETTLKRELKARRLTINAVAKACSIPISVLHSWVNGVLPSAKNLHHIATLANYLEIPVATLLFGETENSKSEISLFSSTFKDGKSEYRMTIKKVSKE